MKLAVVGSRNFHNYMLVEKELNKFDFDLMISGGAIGADSLGERYAFVHNIETLIFKPDWNKHGRSAGFIRNKLIVDECDTLIAFWDFESKGTKNSIDTAKKMGKTVIVINTSREDLF